MSNINVGIIGFGTVGAGAYEVLTTNAELIHSRVGAPVVVKKIADLDINSDRGVPISRDLLTKDAEQVINDPEIDVVVELIGGLTHAKEYILQAMEKGKHVVTANKALLAEYGHELYGMAEKCGVNLEFEASVGGGIPIIGAMKAGLSANRFKNIMAILNGTSNYILTKMSSYYWPYDKVVKEAVELGYAEDPPTLDVDGTDAAHKLAILISLAHGYPVAFKDIYREGITSLTPDDIRFAQEFGYCVKLLALARDRGDGVEARVHPVMIPKDHILANVNWAYNAIYIEGDFVGPNLYYGLGAGRRPTGSAVAADIIELSRRIVSGEKGILPPLAHYGKANKRVAIKPMNSLTMPYYFRFSAVDRPGVLSKISGVLGEHDISIASVIQKGREVNGPVPVVMLTHEALEENVKKAISVINQMDVVTDKTVIIRVERGMKEEI
ncbi:MAG: homoserine dehydrogenase [Deltaproteobacteria bacterium]|nr:MAG: homoserine dehydrogenase [Deltaproteobacteria bacterium]